MEENRSALYRKYQGGVLVYDSHSRIPFQEPENLPFHKNSVSPEVAKEIEKCDPYGK
jgi:hypothetical protein